MGVGKVYADGTIRKVGCGGGAGGANVSDTFNRADGPGIGTASDGIPWVIRNAPTDTLASGIDSNAAYVDIGYIFSASRVVGTACDVTAVMSRSNTSGYSLLWVALNPAIGDGYAVRYDSSTTLSIVRFDGGSLSANDASGIGTVLGASFSGTAWTGGSTTLRLVHDGAGGLSLYQNGVLLGTRTDGSPLSGCTSVGFGALPGNTAGDRWDSFTATGTPLPGSDPGRLKGYFDGQIWQEACDGDTGHPIEISLPGGVTTLVCMTPV